MTVTKLLIHTMMGLSELTTVTSRTQQSEAPANSTPFHPASFRWPAYVSYLHGGMHPAPNV